MAKKPISPPTTPKTPVELTVSREEAKLRLQGRIEKGLEIKNVQISAEVTLDAQQNEFSKWNSFNSTLLKKLFNTDELADEYDYWRGGSVRFSLNFA